MTTEYKIYKVGEADFGASTSLAVKIEDGKVTESLDTSSYETNWGWDGGFEDGMLNGKTKEEAEEIMNHWFDDFEDDCRRPYIREDVLDARDWTRIKAQHLKEEKIRDSIEKGALKRNERYKARKEHKDVLAEKEHLLDVAEKRAKAKPKKAYQKHLRKQDTSAEKEEDIEITSSYTMPNIKSDQVRIDKARLDAYRKFSQRTN